ncbi:MAG TPA: hypothetical protein PKL84_08510, partial [Candidatus Hydrogenedentes bacterium]|nr:hypothetical protein [Candidatus Hydrogenedentota bacterium]
MSYPSRSTILYRIGVLLVLTATQEPARAETLAEIGARLSAETKAAYEASPFSALSRDYFSRFSRDPDAVASEEECAIDSEWRIVIPAEAAELTRLMAETFVEFMERCMGVSLEITDKILPTESSKTIAFLETGGGDPDTPDSFTLDVAKEAIVLSGQSVAGLRDGIARLIDRIGMRQAPFLPLGKQVYTPRLRVRLGATPFLGSYRDVVLLGYNTVFAAGGNLHALSTSDAIPELAARRVEGLLEGGVSAAREARRWGLKTYAFIDTRQKFPKDDPVFEAHPDIRGALTWKADGEYTLCTEHPLVKQFLRESVEGIFRADPQLDGLVMIIGGEGFYHCYMRPYGVEKGRTNCPRCDALGAEQVVANLMNLLKDAARSASPNAEVLGWPYSAEHVWSADKAQLGLIERLEPGAGIFSEIEKDEYVRKPDGVNKHLWDYSIDLIGPGDRARAQVAACKARGLPVYLKSEPELGFEAPRLPHIPCMDRWAARAEALASCGADGAWVFPAFRPCYGASASEINKLFWWTLAPDPDSALAAFAARIAGPEAAPHLRAAWRYVSEAIEWSPELPSYYTGPYYLGPAHPMCADPDAAMPDVFKGRYLFHAEIADAEGLKLTPTYVVNPTGNIPVFGRFYREMERLLK